MNSPHTPSPIEVKFSKVNALRIVLHPAAQVELIALLTKRFGKEPGMYAAEVATLSLENWTDEDLTDNEFKLDQIVACLRQAGLHVVEVRSHSSTIEEAAEQLGLKHEQPQDAQTVSQDSDDAAPPSAQTELPPNEADDTAKAGIEAEAIDQSDVAEAKQPPQADSSVAGARTTKVIKQSVRSGQRIYAQGSDLIVVGQVSAGAEVIADGNVHVYGVLRGRALAGANGNTQATIISTCFEAELVSIAGFYLTFEGGHDPQVKNQPALVELSNSEPPKVCVKSLNIR